MILDGQKPGMIAAALKFRLARQPLAVRLVLPRLLGQFLDQEPLPALTVFAAPDAPGGGGRQDVHGAQLHGGFLVDARYDLPLNSILPELTMRSVNSSTSRSRSFAAWLPSGSCSFSFSRRPSAVLS